MCRYPFISSDEMMGAYLERAVQYWDTPADIRWIGWGRVDDCSSEELRADPHCEVLAQYSSDRHAIVHNDSHRGRVGEVFLVLSTRHEYGHAIGLGHSGNPKNIMYHSGPADIYLSLPESKKPHLIP